MTFGDREKRLLGFLGVVLVIAVGYRLWPLLRPGEDGVDADAAARTATSKIELPALRAPEGEVTSGSFAPGRDPFRFGTPPAPPPPPPPSKEELAAARQRQEEADAANRAAEEQRRIYASTPHPPAVDVRFLGSFGPQTHRIAVFSDAAGKISNVAEGEVVEGKFLVFKIGFESVDLKFVGFPNEPPKRLAAGAAVGGVP